MRGIPSTHWASLGIPWLRPDFNNPVANGIVAPTTALNPVLADRYQYVKTEQLCRFRWLRSYAVGKHVTSMSTEAVMAMADAAMAEGDQGPATDALLALLSPDIAASL